MCEKRECKRRKCCKCCKCEPRYIPYIPYFGPYWYYDPNKIHYTYGTSVNQNDNETECNHTSCNCDKR